MKPTMAAVAMLAGIFAAQAGLSQDSAVNPPTPPVDTTARAVTDKPRESAVDYPVASVNREIITRSQVDRRLAIMLSRQSQQGAATPTLEQALDIEIERALIIQAAEKETNDDVKEQLKKIAREAAEKDADPRKYKRPPTDSQVDVYYRDMLLQLYLQKKIIIANSVTPSQLRTYYDTHMELFGGTPTVTIREILIRQRGRTAEEAKALVDRAAARVAAGEDFAAVAKEASESSYAAQGGLWPAEGRGKLIPEVEKVAFAMKTGEVSAPFTSPLGWHMIRVEEADAGQVRPFSEVQQQIYEQLLNEQRRNAEAQLITGLKSKAIIRKLAS